MLCFSFWKLWRKWIPWPGSSGKVIPGSRELRASGQSGPVSPWTDQSPRQARNHQENDLDELLRRVPVSQQRIEQFLSQMAHGSWAQPFGESSNRWKRSRRSAAWTAVGMALGAVVLLAAWIGWSVVPRVAARFPTVARNKTPAAPSRPTPPAVANFSGTSADALVSNPASQPDPLRQKVSDSNAPFAPPRGFVPTGGSRGPASLRSFPEKLESEVLPGQMAEWLPGQDSQLTQTLMILSQEFVGNASHARLAWDKRPRVWSELGYDPRHPQRAWLLVVAQMPWPQRLDPSPRLVLVPLFSSHLSKNTKVALSRHLARVATLGNQGSFILVLPGGKVVRCRGTELGAASNWAALLACAHVDDPRELVGQLRRALVLLGQESHGNQQGKPLRLVVLTDLPFPARSARQAVAWARRWGDPLRHCGPTTVVQLGSPISGDAWPLVATVWRSRLIRPSADRLAPALWQALLAPDLEPSLYQVRVRWSGEYVEQVLPIDAPPPPGKTSPVATLWLPGERMAWVYQLKLRQRALKASGAGPLAVVELGSRQDQWKVPVAWTRKKFSRTTELFRTCWLVAHLDVLPQLPKAQRSRAWSEIRRLWNSQASQHERLPENWRQMLQAVEKVPLRGP